MLQNYNFSSRFRSLNVFSLVFTLFFAKNAVLQETISSTFNDFCTAWVLCAKMIQFAFMVHDHSIKVYKDHVANCILKEIL